MSLDQEIDEAKKAAILNSLVPEKEKDSDFQKWLEVADDILNFLEHDLRGDTYHQAEKKWVPMEIKESKDGLKANKPMINERGIRKIMALARTVVNKNTFLSKLDEDQIRMMTIQLNLDLIDVLFLGKDDYEIDTRDLTIIEDKVVFFIFNGLNRALGGGERAFLSTTTKRIESVNQEKKGKLLGIFG